MHIVLHRAHCSFDQVGDRVFLHDAEAMSEQVEGQRISFSCVLVKFPGGRSCGPEDHSAVAVGFITSPPGERNVDEEILSAIRECILDHNMRFLVGTMPLDENEAMSKMLSKCGAYNVIYQPFVRERYET